MFIIYLLLSEIKKMELNVLRIDLDAKTELDAINIIKNRLSYIHDLGFFNADKIRKIVLVTKTATSVKMYLKTDLSENMIVILQLILGSDYRKEVNTLINHHFLKMQYSNRMFDVKRYKDKSIKKSTKKDITLKILFFIYNPFRQKNKN